MTREELLELGHTDAQLDTWYDGIIGKHMNLADEAEDTPKIQARRRRFFETVMRDWQGVYRNPNGPKMGSFGDDDPEVHERMRNEA